MGAIFRTADAIGVSKIYLTGYTPAPLDRFKRERSDIAKAALISMKDVKGVFSGPKKKDEKEKPAIVDEEAVKALSAKIAKDVSAGMVLLTAIGAVVVAGITLLPPLFERLGS